jgi:hypothetical protein
VDINILYIKELQYKARIKFIKTSIKHSNNSYNDEIQLAIEEKKPSYRKYLLNKTVEHYIEYKNTEQQ